MKKDQKQLLYSFITKTESFLQGYALNETNTPAFTDDEENTDKFSSSGNTNIENIDKPVSGITLSTLNNKVQTCTRCTLSKLRKHTVFGIGVEHPLVLVIGDFPNKEEDESNKPLIGTDNQLLEKMLQAIKLSKNTNCYITNCIKCRTPSGRAPQEQEVSACLSFLVTQIHCLKPKMILAMGKTAANALLNNSSTINNLREKLFDFNGIPLMVTFHPNELLQNEALKRPAWEDLKLFKNRLDSIMYEQNLNLVK